MNPLRATRRLGFFGRWLGLSAYLVFALFPLYWLLKIALTPTKLLYSEGIRLWPSASTLEHFGEVWKFTNFPAYFWNSSRVSISAAILATLAGALAGYGLSRWRFRGKTAVSFLLL